MHKIESSSLTVGQRLVRTALMREPSVVTEWNDLLSQEDLIEYRRIGSLREADRVLDGRSPGEADARARTVLRYLAAGGTPSRWDLLGTMNGDLQGSPLLKRVAACIGSVLRLTVTGDCRVWDDEAFYTDGSSPEAPFASERAIDALLYAQRVLTRVGLPVDEAPIFGVVRAFSGLTLAQAREWSRLAVVPPTVDTDVMAVAFSRARRKNRRLDALMYDCCAAAVQRTISRGDLTPASQARLVSSFDRVKRGRTNPLDVRVAGRI